MPRIRRRPVLERAQHRGVHEIGAHQSQYLHQAAFAEARADRVERIVAERACIEQLAAEANDVLMHVDKVSPHQQRFAILMEQLAGLAPVAPKVEGDSEGDATEAESDPA